MRFAVCAVALVGLASSAQAAALINNTGLSSPGATITFSEVALNSNDAVTTQFSSYGVTFATTAYYDPQPGFFPTAAIGNYSAGAGGVVLPLSIYFSQAQTDVAFALMTNPGNTTTFTALLNGSVVEQFSATTTLSSSPDLSHASDYYGFTGISFNEIQISPDGQYLQMDNLQTSVPEPSVLAGLSLLGLLLRRSRA